jgi:hypothetical protein
MISHYCYMLPLLAQRLTSVTPAEVSKNLGRGPLISVQWILVAIGLIITIISFISLLRWYRTRHLHPRPYTVFRQLACAQKLTLTQQWLLWRVARHQKLPNPITLMFCKRTLHHHVEDFLDRAPRFSAALLARHVASIERKLFSNDEQIDKLETLLPPAPVTF